MLILSIGKKIVDAYYSALTEWNRDKSQSY